MGDHSALSRPLSNRIRRYAKFVVALAGAVGTGATTVTMTEGRLTLQDGINIGIAVLTALGVLGVRNKTEEE